MEGGEPITRASVAILEYAAESEQTTPRIVINPDLPSKQKSVLSSILRTFEHVFAQNPKCPPLVYGVTHRIDTRSPPLPYKQKPIPVALAVEDKISKIVDEMPQDGICRRSPPGDLVDPCSTSATGVNASS